MPPKSAPSPSPVTAATETPIVFARVGSHHDLPVPSRATPGAAGIDLAAAEAVTIKAGNAVTPVRLGFAVAIPEGYVGLLCVRSGLAKRGVSLTNGVGVIDADYRGELAGLFTKMTPKDLTVEAGERVAQLVIVPVLTAPISEGELPSTKRGSGGFGSTGR